MTDENDLSSTLEDLFGDTDQAEELDLDILKTKAAELTEKFVPIALKTKGQLELKDDDEYKQATETRTIKVTLPEGVWEGIDLMNEMFQLFEENPDSKHLPSSVTQMVRRSQEMFDSSLEETVVSQAAMDNIVTFINSMAQTSLMSKISAAVSSPEKMQEVLEDLGKIFPDEEK